MGLIHIKERGGNEEYRFKKALRMAKDAIEEICDLSDEMEEQFSERGSMSRRSDYRMHDGMDMDERRGRGRYM